MTFNKHFLITYMTGKFLCFIYISFAFFASKLVIKTNYDVFLLVADVCEMSVCVLNVTIRARQPYIFNRAE
jgi:hypothetical protein